MAARSDAATDRVTLASAPSTAAMSMGGWIQISNDRNDFSTFCRLFSSGGGTAITLGTKADGVTPFVFSPLNSTGVAAAAQTPGNYFYIGYSLGSAGAVALYYGTTPGSLTKVTGTVAANGTADSLCLFGRSASDATEWFDGIEAHWRIWTAVLSDAEFAAESASPDPVRTSGLWADWDFAAAALTDGSGNGRNLTAGSTALTSATDPVLGSPTQAGTALLTLGASGTQQRAVAAAGTSTVTLGAIGTQQRVATAAGTASVALNATGTATTQRAAAGTAGLTLDATGTSTRVATDAGVAALVLAASGTQNRVATTSGLAALTLGGDGAALHVAAAAGTAELVLQATGTVGAGSDEQAGTAVLVLDASGAHTAVRTAGGAAILVLDAAGVGEAVLPIVDTGTSVLVLGTTGQALAVRSAFGAAVLELAATGVVSGEQRDITVHARLLPPRTAARLLPPRWHIQEVS